MLAALGLVVSERRRDVQRSVLLDGRRARPTEADELARAQARPSELGEDADVRIVAELRYRGQAFELAVELERPTSSEDFHAAHEEAYGYRDPEAEVELVTLRATATDARARDRRRKRWVRRPSGAERSRRDTVFGDTEIITGEPEPGETHRGPGDRRAARGDARRAGGLERRGARVGHDPDRAMSLDPVTLRVAAAPCAPPARRWARC